MGGEWLPPMACAAVPLPSRGGAGVGSVIYMKQYYRTTKANMRNNDTGPALKGRSVIVGYIEANTNHHTKNKLWL
jgi:hypothetical protein